MSGVQAPGIVHWMAALAFSLQAALYHGKLVPVLVFHLAVERFIRVCRKRIAGNVD
jgi:hypothetical protein